MAIRDLAFREIKKIWSAEESDIIEQEEGFDWLPASHKVHVRMRRDEDDPSRYRLWVTTEFLRSVGSDDEKTAVDIRRDAGSMTIGQILKARHGL